MKRFDDDLHEALSTEQPPAGFADRVLARAVALDARQKPARSWGWVAAVAMVVLFSGGSFLYLENSRRILGERRKDEVLLALRLTASKLRVVQQRLTEIQEQTIDAPLN